MKYGLLAGGTGGAVGIIAAATRLRPMILNACSYY